MTRIAYVVAIAISLPAAACDPNAKASSNDDLVVSRDRLSRQYESCARTADCAEALRCFERTCVSTESSVVGEYNAVLGARAIAASNVPKAIEAYTAAVNRYESDRVPVPAGLLCAKGKALAAGAEDQERGEAAALALHQCLRQTPVGSTVRRDALTALAGLGRLGLDPELLAREEDMKAYLTKQPAGPSVSSIQVKVAGDSKSSASTYKEWLALIESENARALLLPCWEANYKATKEKSMNVALGVKHRFYMDEYEEANDRDKLTFEGQEPAAGSPEKCVRDALDPLAQEFTKGKRTGQRWDSTLTITLGQ